MRLSDLFEKWKIELRGAAAESSNRISVRATFPDDGNPQYAGSYVDLELNVQKGFLIEKAEIVEYGIARAADGGAAPPVRTSWQVLEWHDSETGLSYPSHVRYCNHGAVTVAESDEGFSVQWTATDIALNVLPEDESLGFAFPVNSVVQESATHGESGRIYVWGPDNAPAIEFNSSEEFEAYRRKVCDNGASRGAAPQSGGNDAPLVPASRPVTLYRSVFAINVAGALAVLAFLWRRSRKGGL